MFFFFEVVKETSDNFEVDVFAKYLPSDKELLKIWEQGVHVDLEESSDEEVKKPPVLKPKPKAAWMKEIKEKVEDKLDADAKAKYFAEYGGDGSVIYVTESGVVGASDYYIPRYMCEGDSSRGIEATTPDLCMHARGECSNCGLEKLNQYADVFAAPETAPKGRLVGCPVAPLSPHDVLSSAPTLLP